MVGEMQLPAPARQMEQSLVAAKTMSLYLPALNNLSTSKKMPRAGTGPAHSPAGTGLQDAVNPNIGAKLLPNLSRILAGLLKIIS